MVPLSAGAIEKGEKLYFQGFLKAIDDEDWASPARGIPVVAGGPVKEWWTIGYRPDEIPMIGISTDHGHYFLQEPSEAYAPVNKDLVDKTTLTKLVFNALKDYPASDPPYEDCLTTLTSEAFSMGLEFFTEDKLLLHAEYVLDVMATQDEEEADESKLGNSRFAARLKTKAGHIGPRKRVGQLHVPAQAREMLRTTSKPREFSKATTTPLVNSVFDSFSNLRNQLKKQQGSSTSAQNNNDKSKCGQCEACRRPHGCGKCEGCESLDDFDGHPSDKPVRAF